MPQNRTTPVYIDLVAYLQHELGDTYFVSNELNNDMNFDKKTYVVVKALASDVYSASADLKYQLYIYTDRPSEIINELTEFVKTHTAKTIQSFVPINDKETSVYNIYQQYTTPTVMESDIQDFDNVPYSRIAMFVSLLVMQDTKDIVKVEIDGENIHTLSRDITYVANVFSHRVSGQGLNDNDINSASTSITIKIINNISIFTNKLALIRQGKLDKNTIFNVALTYSNGSSEQYRCICTSINEASSRGVLPGTSITLIAKV